MRNRHQCACALLVAAAAGGVAAISAGWAEPSRPTIYCGADAWTPRWSVKTLTDKAAHHVDWKPRSTTVAKLRSLERPPRVTSGTPRQASERQVFLLRGRLLRFQLRTNNDYELVVADPRDTRRAIVAAIPSPDCTVGAQHRAAMTRVRDTFNQECLNLKHPTVVTIAGVRFFASRPFPSHSAPNGAELAPLLTFTSSC
jgi:hypothetical protein